MAGSTFFRKTETCPSCGRRIVHECGEGSTQPAYEAAVEALERLLAAHDNPTRFIIAIEFEHARAALARLRKTTPA